MKIEKMILLVLVIDTTFSFAVLGMRDSEDGVQKAQEGFEDRKIIKGKAHEAITQQWISSCELGGNFDQAISRVNKKSTCDEPSKKNKMIAALKIQLRKCEREIELLKACVSEKEKRLLAAGRLLDQAKDENLELRILLQEKLCVQAIEYYYQQWILPRSLTAQSPYSNKALADSSFQPMDDRTVGAVSNMTQLMNLLDDEKITPGEALSSVHQHGEEFMTP